MKNINDFKKVLTQVMYVRSERDVFMDKARSVRTAINSNLILYKYLNITPIDLGNDMYVIEISNDYIGQFRIPIAEEDFITLSNVDFEDREKTISAEEL